jgi:hypothetical protein
MPENRLSADFDHRLGQKMALFADASAVTSGQNDDFQCRTSNLIRKTGVAKNAISLSENRKQRVGVFQVS